ncbi:unnamed protein product [Rhodiola kirilowii]
MASAAASSSITLRPTTSSAATPSTRLATTFVRFPRKLGSVDAAVDPLLSLHVASKVRATGTKPLGNGVISMAKKSVGDLKAADLKGKKVFVRADRDRWTIKKIEISRTKKIVGR